MKIESKWIVWYNQRAKQKQVLKTILGGRVSFINQLKSLVFVWRQNTFELVA